MSELELPALDGANPLAFLAALGTLAVLTESDASIQLGWRSGARWTPVLVSENPLDESAVLQRVTTRLRGQPVDSAKGELRDAAEKRYEAAKKNLKRAVDAFKKRGLRGKERDAAREQDIAPHAQACDAARGEFLAAHKLAVRSPELALGKRPDCTVSEFREHARIMRGERRSTDLLAAFGAELSDKADQQIVATPFCFITGSGHQWFLDTAGDLMALATENKVREALFEPWQYRDEKLTMRWDPLDDRRYALMDRDPTASDNKSATVWMANLLAYQALAFFPCAPARRGAATAGWSGKKDSPAFRWPIWPEPLTASAIRSLLTHRAFGDGDLSAGQRAEFRARGVAAIYHAARIQVGNPPLHKINFTPTVAR